MVAPKDVAKVVKDVVVRKFDVDAVVLFGSSLRKKNYNDIDILIITDAPAAEVRKAVLSNKRVAEHVISAGAPLDLAVFPLQNVTMLKPFQFIGMFLDGYEVIYAKKGVKQELKNAEKVVKSFKDKIKLLPVEEEGKKKPLRIPVYK